MMHVSRFAFRMISLVLLMALLAACAESGAQQPTTEAAKTTFVIGMSQANDAEPWRTAMNAQIKSAAAKHPELTIIFKDAQQDNAKQIADIQELLDQQIDLLIVSPNEAVPLTEIVAKAYKQVPVIVLDRKVAGDQYTMWIGADNKAIGKKAGTYAATWCKEQQRSPCQIMELRGLEGATPTLERGDGFREGIITNPDAMIVASQNADWLDTKAVDIAAAMLANNPDIDIIYAHNDPMAEGAIVAAKQTNFALDQTLIIGIDALPTPEGGIASVIGKRINASYVYPTGGAEAIDWTLKILKDGATPPKDVILDTQEVTADNAEALMKSFQ